jgi:hypothetical protein
VVAGAPVGVSGNHTRFYWGLKLYLVTTLEGMPVVWCLAHARDLAAFSAGVVVIGDKGFAGREFERDMTELGRRTRPRRPTHARPRRRDLAQLGHRRTCQAPTDRL